jgi:predicted transposase YdaD
MRQLPPERASQYSEHAYNMSPLAVQRILEQLMTSDYWPVYSPFAKEHFGRGKREGRKEGKQEGEAEAILLFLEARGLPVTDAERERIIGCTDLKQLKKWVTRAATAEKAADLFG